MTFLLILSLILVLIAIADYAYLDGILCMTETPKHLMLCSFLMAVPIVNLFTVVLLIQTHASRKCYH